MRRSERRGFTLIELLIVISILILLLALLGPSLGKAYRTWRATQCTMNLKRIFEAQNTWRNAHGTDHFATGPSWVWSIFPYVDGVAEVLQCPESQASVEVEYHEDYIEETGGRPKTVVQLGDIVWEIYSGNDYLYDIPLDSEFIFVLPAEEHSGNDWTRYEIEDQQTGGDYNTDAKDITVEVRYEQGIPVEIYFSPDHTGHAYTYKFKIQDKIIHDPALENGQYFDLTDLSHYGIAGGTANIWGFGVCDYGMSTGSYQVVGYDVPKPDGKLFFILDYPKPLADYNQDDDDDNWDEFFVEDFATWEPPEDFDWDDAPRVQALRHLNRANVLFCDGHVESLGVDPIDAAALRAGKYLRADSPLWRYSGR